MGRESRNGKEGHGSAPSGAQFGWRPDALHTPSDGDGNRVLTHPSHEELVTEPAIGSPPPSNGNGHGNHNGHGSELDMMELLRRFEGESFDLWPDDVPLVQELRLARQAAQTRRRGRRSRSPRRTAASKLVLHGLVLFTIVLVVAGHGYWSGNPQSAPTPTDSTRDLRLGELPTSSTFSTTTLSYKLASTSGGSPSGYISQLGSAVTPQRLDITTVTSKSGESISDIARETGRSIDTLLWANSLTDPAKPLAPGTQVEVPPVDGMLHVVHDSDTLESIAARYQVDVEAITGYAPNNVQSTADLVPYRLIMVPDGTMPTRDEVVTYVVREGDSLATIAQYFGLQSNTIVWANSLPDGDLIFPGQHLAILLTDGVMVTIKDGDSIDALAEKYGVTAKEILDYPGNGLGSGGQVRVGQQIMVPGGAPPAPPPPPPAPVQAAPAPAPAAPDTSVVAPPPPVQASSSSFIWPANGTITQYFGPTSFWMEPAYAGYAHFHQGLDIANVPYTPIVAAGSGTVVFSGWNTSGYGYAVSIDHGNGLVSWYGHMAQQPSVWVGQHVNQGEYLGPMGSTGASSGSHTHFAVLRNGVWDDPLKYLP